MSDDDSESRVVSPKELARMMRKKAYQRAKALRAQDPRYLAMKEAAKKQRRDAYRTAKEKHKAASATQKAADKKSDAERKSSERQARDGELKKLLSRGHLTLVPPLPEQSEDTAVSTEKEDAPTTWRLREKTTPYDVN